MPDLLHTIPWGWITGRKDPSSEATIYLMLGFTSRYNCTFWEKVCRACEMGWVSRKSCSADEWYSSYTMHSRADENLDRCKGPELEGSLGYYPEVLQGHCHLMTMHWCCYLSMLFASNVGHVVGVSLEFMACLHIPWIWMGLFATSDALRYKSINLQWGHLEKDSYAKIYA